MLRPNLILVAVTREMGAQPVRWFARVPSADGVGDHKKISAEVQRLPGAVKRVEEGGLREVGSRSRGAVKQQNPIGDCATRVATWRSKSQIVQLQRRQGLAIVKDEVV